MMKIFFAQSKSELLYLALVLTAILYASFGIWNARIPFGDEGVHVLQGYKVLEGMPSTNLYYLTYAAIFRFITDDFVLAHLIFRFFSTAFSTLGLYFLLRCFQTISPLAATVACLAWAGSALNSPFAQIGNINLFSFSLAMTGLVFLLRKPSIRSLMIFVFFTLWASSVRPEYLAPLILVTIGGIFFLYTRRSAYLTVPTNKLANAAGICFLILILGMSTWVIFSKSSGTSFDGYLLQGLGQCYSVEYKRLHPQEQFDPMTEYQQVLDKVFGSPKTFKEALFNNPAEAIRYFLRNGIRNLLMVPAGLLSSGPQALPNILVKLLLLSGIILGIHEFYRRHKQSDNFRVKLPADADKILLLFLFTSASFAALVLLINDPRYWISWTPLIYLLLAWSIDRVFEKLKEEYKKYILLFVCFVVLPQPIFLNKSSNQPVIHSLRKSISGLQKEPVIAGNFVVGLATFAFKGKAIQVNTYNGLSPTGLRNRTYDVFLADGLSETMLWKNNQEFFEEFVNKPEAFGYRLLTEGIAIGMHVYVRNM